MTEGWLSRFLFDQFLFYFFYFLLNLFVFYKFIPVKNLIFFLNLSRSSVSKFRCITGQQSIWEHNYVTWIWIPFFNKTQMNQVTIFNYRKRKKKRVNFHFEYQQLHQQWTNLRHGINDHKIKIYLFDCIVIFAIFFTELTIFNLQCY